MSVLNTEFKPSKKPLRKVHNLNLYKSKAVTEEVLGNLQLLLIATYPAIVRLKSAPDHRQRPNIAMPRDKTDN